MMGKTVKIRMTDEQEKRISKIVAVILNHNDDKVYVPRLRAIEIARVIDDVINDEQGGITG